MTATVRYQAAGTTDDVTTCDVCGRADLKSTIVLAVVDVDGNRVDTRYAGSWCGAQVAGRPVREFDAAAKAADRAAAKANDAAARAAHRDEAAAWSVFAAIRFPAAAATTLIGIRRAGYSALDYRTARADFASGLPA